MTSLLPANATAYELVLEKVVNRPDPDVPLRQLFDADTCPIAILPWLAWALSIENWSPDWSESIQREAVRQAIYIQSIKGTRGSVESAVQALGGTAYIREWWEQSPPADPYTFLLALDLNGPGGAAPTSSYIDSVIEEVNRTKPARAHFDFTLKLVSASAIGLKAVARVAATRRLELTAI